MVPVGPLVLRVNSGLLKPFELTDDRAPTVYVDSSLSEGRAPVSGLAKSPALRSWENRANVPPVHTTTAMTTCTGTVTLLVIDLRGALIRQLLG